MKYNVEIDAIVVPKDRNGEGPASVEFGNVTDLPTTIRDGIQHIEIVGKIKDLEIYVHGEEE